MGKIKQPNAKEFLRQFTSFTPRRLIVMITGNLILALGVALFGKAGLGNHPFHTMLYGAANFFGGDLWRNYANCQVVLNIVLFAVVFLWGRKHIGPGTIVNMFLLGYAVDGCGKALDYFGIKEFLSKGDYIVSWLGLKNYWQLAFELLATVLISLGISLYQAGDLGAAPYDALALMAVDRKKPFTPYRMLCDGSCLLLTIIFIFITGWENTPPEARVGIGTVITVFCTGPFIHFFDVTISNKLAGKKAV